jgi:hypothetical protein
MGGLVGDSCGGVIIGVTRLVTMNSSIMSGNGSLWCMGIPSDVAFVSRRFGGIHEGIQGHGGFDLHIGHTR